MSLVGVGIDLLEVARVRRLLDQYGDRFVGRWFTPAEVDWCRESGSRSAAFAAVMAGKEAVWKALRLESPGPVPWRSLEVLPDDRGGRVTLPPTLVPEETNVDVRVRTGNDVVVAYALAWTGVTPTGADETWARLPNLSFLREGCGERGNLSSRRRSCRTGRGWDA